LVLEPSYKELMPLFEKFFREIAKEKGDEFEKLKDELDAVEKLLRHQKLFTLPILAVTYRNKLIGFTINEIIDGGDSHHA